MNEKNYRVVWWKNNDKTVNGCSSLFTEIGARLCVKVMNKSIPGYIHIAVTDDYVKSVIDEVGPS